MENIVYIICVTFFLAGVGNVAGGAIEDAQWEAGRAALQDCDTIDKEFWKGQCEIIPVTYEETYEISEKMKLRNQFLGTITPLVIGTLFAKKSLS